MLTYWLLGDDKLKRLTRLESRHSETSPIHYYRNNNVKFEDDNSDRLSGVINFSVDLDSEMTEQPQNNTHALQDTFTPHDTGDTDEDDSGVIAGIQRNYINSSDKAAFNHLNSCSGQKSGSHYNTTNGRVDTRVEMTPLLSNRCS